MNYDSIASTYNNRYEVNRMDEVEAALLGLASGRVLEVGCGTGRWLRVLAESCAFACGADFSFGMLRQALPLPVVQADANLLPFRSGRFDLVYCVNAIHHFTDFRAFLADAVDLLRATGVLAVVGIDPRWHPRRYFYEWFEGAREMDLDRYPAHEHVVEAMTALGLSGVSLRVVERYGSLMRGKELWDDPFLLHRSNSLLALLSNEVYDRGLQKMRAAIDADPEITFDSRLEFVCIAGRKL